VRRPAPLPPHRLRAPDGHPVMPMASPNRGMPSSFSADAPLEPMVASARFDFIGRKYGLYDAPFGRMGGRRSRPGTKRHRPSLHAVARQRTVWRNDDHPCGGRLCDARRQHPLAPPTSVGARWANRYRARTACPALAELALIGTECGRRITECGKDTDGDRELARRRNSGGRPPSVGQNNAARANGGG